MPTPAVLKTVTKEEIEKGPKQKPAKIVELKPPKSKAVDTMTKKTAKIQAGMDVKFHPASNIFPPIPKDELELLAEDIKTNGLEEPITLYHGKILDGRARYQACQMSKIDPVFVEWEPKKPHMTIKGGKGYFPHTYVITKNLFRRHLTSQQRAVLSLKLLPQLEKEAKARMRAGKKTKPSQKIAQGKATEQAAKLCHTNRQYVSAVKKIQEKAPKKLDQIWTGEKTIAQVTKEIKKKKAPKTQKVPANVLVLNADIPLVDMRTSPTAVMFLRTSLKTLPNAIKIVSRQGFSYVSAMVINNVEREPDQAFVNVKHDLLLIGKKAATPEPAKKAPCTIKEDKIFETIETMYPGEGHFYNYTDEDKKKTKK